MNGIFYIILGLFLLLISTPIGSLVLFLFKNKNSEKVNKVILGFASGVMISASVFGLIVPAIEQSQNMGVFQFLPATLGLIIGSVFLFVVNKITCNNFIKQGKNLSKSYKLFFVVTIHNIPEGLAVGIAFGSAIVAGQISAYISALILTVGIALQNIPEGASVSLSAKNELGNTKKAFYLGTFSGLVEPIFAIIGMLFSTWLCAFMPWLLCISAGAMIFVTIDDLMPDLKYNNSSLGAWSFMIGFVLMMILDVALG